MHLLCGSIIIWCTALFCRTQFVTISAIRGLSKCSPAALTSYWGVNVYGATESKQMAEAVVSRCSRFQEPMWTASRQPNL